MKDNKHKNSFLNGIVKENPLFVSVLGTCPALAVTKNLESAFGMGLLFLFVLTCSNVIISLIRKLIPEEARTPCEIVVIAAFVTITKMLTEAFLPELYSSLGVFLSLIVVNCIVLGRAEAFANKNSVFDSALDGIGMGLGFTLGLTIIAAIREILGSGTITLFAIGGWNGVIKVPLLSSNPVRVVGMSAGALLVMGLLKAFFTWRSEKKGDKR